jgi:DHA1 family bicyclomycin/chloramphenicol resistance-like MFS transporter
MQKIKLNNSIFTIILSVCVLVPLTNDIFISGMAQMSEFFTGNNISLVLSISLLGLACSQIFYGPLSDRFGRKPVLLMGLVIYIIASAQVMLSDNFNCLLLARFLQAVGVCSAIVSSLAIARDTCDQKELVNATGLIMAILGFGPASAPLLGSFLNYYFGWRSSFVFLFFLGCFYLIWTIIFLEETHKNKNMNALKLKNIWRNYATLARNDKFLKYCITSGCSYGILFSYIGLSSYFIIQKFNYSLINFGVIVFINALAIIGTSLIIPIFAKKISIIRLVKTGMMIIILSGVLMWILNTTISENIYTFMGPIFITTIGIGIIRTTASAGAMQLVEKNIAGSASAFFNFFSFVFGSFATMLITKIIHEASTFGLFILILGLFSIMVIKKNSDDENPSPLE